MKKLLPIFLMISIVTFAQSQSSEIVGNDTLNKIDIAGKKQGKWILRGKHKPGTCFTAEQKIEEGKYADNRKTGAWIEYFCNGNMKNKLTFVNGRPDGYAIMYHENGKISEEGNWKINKWVVNTSYFMRTDKYNTSLHLTLQVNVMGHKFISLITGKKQLKVILPMVKKVV